MNKLQKNEILGRLLLAYIAGNILVESLLDDLGRGLFKHSTKRLAKNLCEELQKDVNNLYQNGLKTDEGIASYSQVFNEIDAFVQTLISEVVQNTTAGE